MENLNIRNLFLCEFHLGHEPIEAAANINKAYGREIAAVRTIQRWFTKFRGGDFSMENDERQTTYFT